MSTTAINPICAGCGLEIDGTVGMLLVGKRVYHNQCYPPLAASPPPSQEGLRLDRLQARLIEDAQLLGLDRLSDAAAALSRLRAELDAVKDNARYHLEKEMMRVAETERKLAAAETTVTRLKQENFDTLSETAAVVNMLGKDKADLQAAVTRLTEALIAARRCLLMETPRTGVSNAVAVIDAALEPHDNGK